MVNETKPEQEAISAEIQEFLAKHLEFATQVMEKKHNVKINCNLDINYAKESTSRFGFYLDSNTIH